MSKRLVSDFVLLSIAVVWGITFVLVQNAIQVLPPFSFLFVRFFLAFLALIPFLIITRKEQDWQTFWSANIVFAGLVLALWLFAGYAFQTVGLLYTISSKAGFITGLSVVLVPVFSLLILKVNPKIPAVVGVLLSLLGLYLLTLGDRLTINKGDILVFFCAIAFAMQIIFTGKYAILHDATKLTVVQLGFVSLLCLIFAWRFEDIGILMSAEVFLNPTVWIALLITSVFATSLAFWAQTHFQRYTTPTRVALIFATEPVFAAITGVLAADETLTTKMILGCVCIFIGMILAELPEELVLRALRMTRKS
jgi:drug/metabolite transporter (DMT)-like permease